LKRYTTSYGLLALLFAVVLMLASCAGAGSSRAEQGSSEEQESGEQGGEESIEGMQGTEDSGVANSQTMGSFDEERSFDLQFIDQMIVHHQGAIMSSEHMIADSERPELRQLAENIQKSQSEQIEQMRAWREQWYPDAEPLSEMMDSAQMEEMMSEGHMQEEMMGGDTADSMFLRMMILHHQSAIDMSEQALERAEHPELRGLAQQIIDEQTAEIGLMEGYLEEIEASDGN
jgi:uncharacterized protein (DUF305 family)